MGSRRTSLALLFSGGALACALSAPLAPLAYASPSSAAASAELVRQAREHEASDDLVAMRRYTDALTLDPTNRDAYLGLGALRLKRGDLREAERVYDVALARLPTLTAALVGRAEARWALGLHDAAEQDLELYAAQEGDLGALKELAHWYEAEARPPAELATWRRIRVLAVARGDSALEREARAMVRALQIVVGAADPVAAPEAVDPVRRGIARVAKRGG
jgi:tetratricopeptide (TPR) repeat protein